MVLCGYCRKNVRPRMHLTWKGFVRGLGIFYLMYGITKIPQCPNCNFPMPRKSMVFAIYLPECFIKLARMSVLQLIHLKDRVISASRMSYLYRKANPSHYASTNAHLTTSLYVMANEDHRSIDLGSYRFRK
jgi:hypothetical protein